MISDDSGDSGRPAGPDLEAVAGAGVGEGRDDVDLGLVVRGDAHPLLRRLPPRRHPLAVAHHPQPHPALLVAPALGGEGGVGGGGLFIRLQLFRAA